MATLDHAAVPTGRAAELILLLGAASGAYGSFCFGESKDVDKDDPEAKAVMRRGEIIATLLTVGTGWAAAQASNDDYLFYAALVISAAFVGHFEYQIRT